MKKLNKNSDLITAEDAARHRVEFERKFGINHDATGTIPPESRCKIAECAVIGKYGSKYDGELLRDMVADAYAGVLATKTDETRPAWQQTKYLSNAAIAAARRTLRNRGYEDGKKIVKAKTSCEFGSSECERFFIELVPDPQGLDAFQRLEDEEERRVMVQAVTKYAICDDDLEVLRGLMQGLTYVEIGKRIGCTRSRVLQRIKAMRRRAYKDAPKILSRFMPKPEPKEEPDSQEGWKRYLNEGEI